MSEPADPIARFNEALRRAEALEPDVPNAVTLATADGDGRPSARVVLLHRADARGFTFFTNYNSRKARELMVNPRAALCVHWKTLKEQVRIEGVVERLSSEESDAYFAGRPQRSQLAAMASKQSAPLGSREALERRHAALVALHGDSSPPRPSYWGGFLLVPERIEFWLHGDHRLHHRVLYQRAGEGWTHSLLYP